MEPDLDWSTLPQLTLCCIVQHVDDVLDLASMRLTCKRWKESVTQSLQVWRIWDPVSLSNWNYLRGTVYMLCPAMERLTLVVSNRTSCDTLLAMLKDLNWWTRLREIVLVSIRPFASGLLSSSFDSTKALVELSSLRRLQALVMEGCDTQMVINGTLRCTQLTQLVVRSRRSPLSIPCRINNDFLDQLTVSERSISEREPLPLSTGQRRNAQQQNPIGNTGGEDEGAPGGEACATTKGTAGGARLEGSAAAAGVCGGGADPPRNGLRHLEFDADAHLDGAASVMALLDNEAPSSTISSDRVNALLEVLPYLEHLDIRRVPVHAPVIRGPLAQLTKLTELRIGIQDGTRTGQDSPEWTALSALGALNALADRTAGSPWRSSSPTFLAAEPSGLPQQQQQQQQHHQHKHALRFCPHKTATMGFEGNPSYGPLPRPCLPMLHLYISRVTKSSPADLLSAMLPLVPRLRTLFMTHRALHPEDLFSVGQLTSLECLGLSFAVQPPDSAGDHASGAGRAQGRRVRNASQLPRTMVQQIMASVRSTWSTNPQQLCMLQALLARAEEGDRDHDMDSDVDSDVDSDDADADLQMADVDFGKKVQDIGLRKLRRLTQLRELHLKGPQRLVGMAGRGPAKLQAMAPRELPQAQRLPSLPRTRPATAGRAGGRPINGPDDVDGKPLLGTRSPGLSSRQGRQDDGQEDELSGAPLRFSTPGLIRPSQHPSAGQSVPQPAEMVDPAAAQLTEGSSAAEQLPGPSFADSCARLAAEPSGAVLPYAETANDVRMMLGAYDWMDATEAGEDAKAAPKAARMAEGQAKATAAAGLRSLPFPGSAASAGGRTAGGSGTTSMSAHRQCLPSQLPSESVRAMMQALEEMEADAEWEDFFSDTGVGTATTMEGPGKSVLMEAGCGAPLWRSYLPRKRRNVPEMDQTSADEGMEMDQTNEDEDMEDEFVFGWPQDGSCDGRSGGRSGGRLAASGTGLGRDLKRSAENPLLHQPQRRQQQQRLQRSVRKRPDSLPPSQKRKGGRGGSGRCGVRGRGGGRRCGGRGRGGGRRCGSRGRSGGNSVGITAHGRSGNCGFALESERFVSPLLSRDDEEELAVKFEDRMQNGAERENAPGGSRPQGMDLDLDLDLDTGPNAHRGRIQPLQRAAAGGRMAARDGGNMGTGIGRWTTAGHGGGAGDATWGARAAAGAAAAAAIACSVSGSNAGMAALVRREIGEDMSMAAAVPPPPLPLELFPRPPVSFQFHEFRMQVLQTALEDLTRDRRMLRRAMLSLRASDIAALRTHGSALEALTLYYFRMPPTVVTELTSALPQLRRLGLRWSNGQDVAIGKRSCICGDINMCGAAATAGTSSIADGNRRGSLEIATLPSRLESLELGGPVTLRVTAPDLGGPSGSRQAPGPVWIQLMRLTLGKGIDLSCAALPALLARAPQITELQLLKPRGLEPADLASLKPLNRLRVLVVNFEPADMECQEMRRAMARGISCVASLTTLQELRWDVPDPSRRKRRLFSACRVDDMDFVDHNVELCQQLSTLTGLRRLSLLSLPSCRHLVRRTEDLRELRNLPFLEVTS